jgi:hypothetical protein
MSLRDLDFIMNLEVLDTNEKIKISLLSNKYMDPDYIDENKYWICSKCNSYIPEYLSKVKCDGCQEIRTIEKEIYRSRIVGCNVERKENNKNDMVLINGNDNSSSSSKINGKSSSSSKV